MQNILIIGATSAIADPHLDNNIFLNTDVFQLEIAADPQISPDGSQVAYVRRSMDIMIDRARSNIWVVGTNGQGHRPLLSGTNSYTSPRWSPNGDRIAYISSAEGRGAELYVRWMDTGQTALLSNLSETPSAISWSPDGRHIAFLSLVPDRQEPMATPPAMPHSQ